MPTKYEGLGRGGRGGGSGYTGGAGVARGGNSGTRSTRTARPATKVASKKLTNARKADKIVTPKGKVKTKVSSTSRAKKKNEYISQTEITGSYGQPSIKQVLRGTAAKPKVIKNKDPWNWTTKIQPSLAKRKKK
jgi:hypothetical protein